MEPEWLETLPALDPDTLLFTDFVEAGRALAGELRVSAQGPDSPFNVQHNMNIAVFSSSGTLELCSSSRTGTLNP